MAWPTPTILYANGAGAAALTSSSLSPAQGSLLVVLAGVAGGGFSTLTLTTTDLSVSAWTEIDLDVQTSGGGLAALGAWAARVTGPDSGTIRVVAPGGTAATILVIIEVPEGYDVDDAIRQASAILVHSSSDGFTSTLPAAPLETSLLLTAAYGIRTGSAGPTTPDADYSLVGGASQLVQAGAYGVLYAAHRTGTTDDEATWSGYTMTGSGGVIAMSIILEIAAAEEVEEDSDPPSVPANLAVTNKSHNSVSLSWDASTDNIGVAGYRVYRDDVLIDSTPSTTYEDSGLDPETQYEYEVAAYDAAENESDRSTPVQVTTEATPPITPPIIGGSAYVEGGNEQTLTTDTISAAPGDLVIALVTRSRAGREITGISSTLAIEGNWQRVGIRNENGTCPEVAIFVAKASESTSGTVTSHANQSTSQALAVYVISGTADETPVRQSKVGTASSASAASVTLDAPSDANSIVLGLLCDVDSESAAVAGAGWTQLYVDNVGGGNGHRVVAQRFTGTVTEVPFASLNGVESAIVAIEIAGGISGEPDEDAPTVPQNLALAIRTHRTVTLGWDASTDNVGVAGYRIYRDNALIDSTPFTTYKDTGLTPETQYEYEVAAYDGTDNESDRSTPLQVTTLAEPPLSLAIIGDSDSDEYRADDDRGQGAYKDATLNWTEILVNTRGLDLGDWGTWGGPRRTGYERNWARSGANLDEIGPQTSGIVSQIGTGDANAVVIRIGINDWKIANGLPAQIYNGTLSGSALDDLIDEHAGYVETAVAALVSAGAVKIAIFHVGDQMALPPSWAAFPNATFRQRFHDALADLNGRFDALKVTYPGVVDTIAVNEYMAALILEIDGNGIIQIGGEDVEAFTPGWDPLHLQLADSGGHASTLGNALFINFILSETDNLWGLISSPLSESEMLEIAYGTWTPADETAPSLQSAEISSDGESLTLTFDETVAIGSGGNGGFSLDASGGAVTTTYASGSGTSALVYSLSRAVYESETVTLDYVQPGEGIEDAAGNDLASFSDFAVSGGKPDEDTTAPSAPEGLTADSVAYNSVSLSWDASTDDVGVTGYNVYRDSVLIGNSMTTSFEDDTVERDTSYSYVVTAYDAADNESAASDELEVTTPPGIVLGSFESDSVDTSAAAGILPAGSWRVYMRHDAPGLAGDEGPHTVTITS